MKDEKDVLIIDRLLEDIVAGKYNENDKLPSENDLADKHKVTRITVRKAYSRLEEMGYLYSKQGKGRYLNNKQQKIDLSLSGDVSFSQKMKDKGYNFDSKNLFCKQVKYNEKIYKELNIGENDKVYKVGRLRLIDNKPIALHISYIAQSLFNDINIVGKDIKSMFEYYKNNGYKEFDSTKSMLSISFPTHFERKIFECSNLIPMLIVESNCIDKYTRKTLEFTKIIYRSDIFKYQIK
ncbi:GntR family transcriptional regulator [Brassicibacter mesophilus]|uniref:GntR family transcriptional regulator n=1 Tax=Brassicibacter mesophilus TaxID=745119 RepID=UPI003D21EC6E